MSSGKPRPGGTTLEAKLARAIALHETDDVQPGERAGALSDVLAAAGFPKGEPLLPLADELTAVQRAVAEELSRYPVQIYGGWALPRKGAQIGRWLGLVPPGVLEREVTVALDGTVRTEPLWRAMQRAGAKVNELLEDLALPLEARLEVFADVYLGAYNLKRRGLRWGSLGEIGPSLGAWAQRTADRLCEGQHGSTELAIKWPVFLALVRAGVAVELRWDWLLPIAEGKETLRLSLQCAEAIPAERRDAAVVAATRRLSFASAIVGAGLLVLPHLPSRELAALILQNADRADDGPRFSRIPKRQTLERLERIAERHAEVAAELARYRGTLPPVPVLRCARGVEVRDPGALTPVQQEQLAAARKSYDGRGPDDPPLEYMELYTVVDEGGRPVYDAWLYMVDSGSIYRTGTTEEIAHVIQMSVTCEDEGLREGLRTALRERPKPSRS